LGNVKQAQVFKDKNEWPMTFAIDFTFKTNLLGLYFGVRELLMQCATFFLGVSV
jgi:hypothetical protein